MKITFIGTGYVGLVSGVMLSHLGHCVTCLDLNTDKIKLLSRKKSPIFEPGLNEFIEKYADTERLNFTANYNESLKDSECVFITVGTPPLSCGDADLREILSAVLQVCRYIKDDCIIAIKSTVPPGTCSAVQADITAKGYKNKVISNPEFLREGTAIDDFLNPDRIVIGASDPEAYGVMRKIYAPFIDEGVKIIETDLATSELIKYTSNAFLANRIAFINETADLCEVIGADIDVLAKAVGADKRIGESFLKAGPGFGGSCFPKDTLALQRLARKANSDFLTLDAIIDANARRPSRIAEKIISILGGCVRGKKIAFLGLTYKAGTDDLRDSPAIKLVNKLQESGAYVIAYDPQGMHNIFRYFEKLECANSAVETLDMAEAIVIATEWEEFKNIDLQAARLRVKQPIIIDLRNILDAKTVGSAGFFYYAIGKKNAK